MVKSFYSDKLKVNIYKTRDVMGKYAAEAIGEKIKELLKIKESINMIFAAAPSQNEMIEALINTPDIDWGRINAFHMDEYIGLEKDAPQGFGNLLRQRLFSKVKFKNIEYIKGQAENIEDECLRYSLFLKQYPVDIVCMGVGENGHIAFNDPPVADFNDEKLVKVVELDEVCRQQQVNDGCFASINDVPKQAVTLTIPALVNARFVYCVVPAETKRKAVYSLVRGDISEKCPASILRTHENASLFCDVDSGRDILFRKAIITDEVSQNFETAAKLAGKYNCEAVEIRSVWDKTPQALSGEDISEINRIAKAYNLKICAISSSVFKCNMDDVGEVKQQYLVLDKCLDLAKATGARLIRIFTFWRNNGIENDVDFIVNEIKKIAHKANKHGITVAVELDPAVSMSDADEMKTLFDKLNIHNVKVLWDPGNQIYNNEFKVPYPNGYNLIKEHIAHIHLKDAVRETGGNAVGVVVGEGLLDISGQLKALLDDGYDGYIVLEPHFRIQSSLSEDELKLPGGSDFSMGGYEASELSFKTLDNIIDKIVG